MKKVYIQHKHVRVKLTSNQLKLKLPFSMKMIYKLNLDSLPVLNQKQSIYFGFQGLTTDIKQAQIFINSGFIFYDSNEGKNWELVSYDEEIRKIRKNKLIKLNDKT